MGIFPKKSPGKGSGLFDQQGQPLVDQATAAASSAMEQASSAMEQATSAAASGQQGFMELKEDVEATVTEAQNLKMALEDQKLPLQVKVVKVFAFLKGPAGWLLGFCWKVLCCLLPLYQRLFWLLYKAYEWAPKKLVTMVVGAVLAFFGGTYVASLAAIEAFRTMGGERLWSDLVYVYEQVLVVNEAHEKDEAAAGTSAAELLDAGKHAELAQRKVYLAMVTLKEPGRLESAVGSLWSAYVAVLATLSLQFAQVVALALGMAETVKPLVSYTVVPILEWAFPPPLHHWIKSIVQTTLNLLAMCIAWYLMSVVAAVYSGLRGGRMFADALFGLIADFGIVSKVPEAWQSTIRPWLDPNTSLIDEAVMYLLAGIGIYSQVMGGFSIFFPLNIVLMPLSAIEWFLRYQITFGGTAP